MIESQKLNILIVEDDYRLLAEWKESLEEAGHKVSIAANGKYAIRLLDQAFDCFIIDLFHVQGEDFLPDGGITVLSRIRKHYMKSQQPFIIAVTGFFKESKDGLISTDQVAQNLGANITLKKPIDPDAFISHIDSWVTEINSTKSI
ncbi:MAG: response regulator [Bacteroidota bacterium]